MVLPPGVSIGYDYISVRMELIWALLPGVSIGYGFISVRMESIRTFCVCHTIDFADA